MKLATLKSFEKQAELDYKITIEEEREERERREEELYEKGIEKGMRLERAQQQ